MAQYINGFVIPVPKKKIKAYKAHAKMFGKLWLEYGALAVNEFEGDFLPKGKITSFGKSVKVKAGETVFFSWTVFKSKADCNRAFAKMMKDPRMENMDPKTWPFDGMRMIYGGFKAAVALKK